MQVQFQIGGIDDTYNQIRGDFTGYPAQAKIVCDAFIFTERFETIKARQINKTNWTAFGKV